MSLFDSFNQIIITLVSSAYRLTFLNRPRRLNSLQRDKQLPRVCWFGNSGVIGVHGISDLISISEQLEFANGISPFELVICSDKKCKEIIRNTKFGFPVSFLPWSYQNCFELVKKSNLVILPFAKNEFNYTKSANRALLALSLNVPVVASDIPSIKEIGNCVVLNDFRFGIPNLLNQHRIS